MKSAATARIWLLHLCVILLLAALQFVLPAYHHGVFARVLVFAVFAIGYNLLFGYAGLLSLGHAMFFAAGLYGAGLTMLHFGWGVPAGFAAGIIAGAGLSLIVGLLALRTSGVAFMIVTMMFSQVLYLTILYYSGWTMGDQGFALGQEARAVILGGTRLDFTSPPTRYWAALTLFSIALLISLGIVRSRHGRVLIAIRENEVRTSMLGYNTFANKLAAAVASGTISAAAGAAYAVLFGFVGANFATVQFSISPLLWVLTGGAATTLGPLIGTLFMYYAVDIASGFTSAWLLIIGLALILLVLFFPRGILGTMRDRWIGWLP